MNKRPIKILAGVGIGSALFLAYKPNRERVKDWGSQLKDILPSSNPSDNVFQLENVGHPHPEDIQDNKMVSEGAMYSVDYYNKSQ